MKKKSSNKNTRNIWKDKIGYLRKIYPRHSNEEVVVLLREKYKINFTVSSVRNAATAYNIKKSDWFWDTKWEKYLLDHWDEMTWREISKGLYKRFGVQKGRWSIVNKHRELVKLQHC